ncbi:MAG: hypothetical protein AB7F43_08975 [Bacteriovoracia bacterium]
MDVGALNEANREVDAMRRLLRKKDTEHANTLDYVKEKNNRRIDDLQESQREIVEDLNRRSEEARSEQHEDYKQDLRRLEDRFDKTISEERQEAYDKLGRVKDEAARERMRQAQIQNKRFSDFENIQEHRSDNKTGEADRQANAIRDQFEKDRLAMKDYSDRRIEKAREQAKDALSTAAVENRQKIDDVVQKNAREKERDKMGAALLYKRLADQTASERKDLKNSFDLREQELIDRRLEADKKNNREGTAIIKEYRDRLGDNFDRTVSDLNFQNALKDQNNTDRLARQNAEHYRREQERASQFRKIETDLKHLNRLQKEQNELKEQNDERLRKEAAHLTVEDLRKKDQLQRDIMKARYENNLQRFQDNAQKDFQGYQDDVRRQGSLREQMINARDKQTQRNQLSDLAKLRIEHNQELYNTKDKMTRANEALNDLRQRQLDDSKEDRNRAINNLTDQKDLLLYRTKREDQAKLQEERENFKEHLHAQKVFTEDNIMSQEALYRAKAKRLNQQYSRSLQHQQDHFKEASEELKHDNKFAINRAKAQANHDRQLAILELQSQNREIVHRYNEKINDMHDQHEYEIEKINAENAKKLRELTKQTQETIEAERKNSERELAIKDLQMKEKLRLQRESFQEQIERLKRTNVYASKKS